MQEVYLLDLGRAQGAVFPRDEMALDLDPVCPLAPASHDCGWGFGRTIRAELAPGLFHDLRRQAGVRARPLDRALADPLVVLEAPGPQPRTKYPPPRTFCHVRQEALEPTVAGVREVDVPPEALRDKEPLR